MTNTFELELKLASHRLIDSVWTMAYIPLGNDQIHVVMYGRDYQHSYLPEIYNDQKRLERKFELERRTLSWVVIDGQRYEVSNQQFIFSYHSDLETFEQLSEVAEIVIENLREEHAEKLEAVA
nr:hypothetical protein [uncultured Vibrio sp.]